METWRACRSGMPPARTRAMREIALEAMRRLSGKPFPSGALIEAIDKIS